MTQHFRRPFHRVDCDDAAVLRTGPDNAAIGNVIFPAGGLYIFRNRSGIGMGRVDGQPYMIPAQKGNHSLPVHAPRDDADIISLRQ